MLNEMKNDKIGTDNASNVEIWDKEDKDTGETIYKKRVHSTGTDDKNISKGERQ